MMIFKATRVRNEVEIWLTMSLAYTTLAGTRVLQQSRHWVSLFGLGTAANETPGLQRFCLCPFLPGSTITILNFIPCVRPKLVGPGAMKLFDRMNYHEIPFYVELFVWLPARECILVLRFDALSPVRNVRSCPMSVAILLLSISAVD